MKSNFIINKAALSLALPAAALVLPAAAGAEAPAAAEIPAASSSPAAAPLDDAAWRREMEEKIDVLTQELEQYRLAGPGAAPAANAAAAATGEATLAPYSLGPSAAKVYGVEQGLAIGGYGEAVYENFKHRTRYSINGDDNEFHNAEADLERFVLYAGYRFSDRILFDSELEAEHANSSKSGEVGAEFAYLDFALWKPLGFRVGELLLPVGLANEYHEPPVFHGVLRPDVEQFLIPTTWHENGAGYYGRYGSVAYRGCLVAGLRAAGDAKMNQTGFQPDTGLREGRQEGSRSRAHDLGYAQRLDFLGAPGFILGGSFYVDNSGQGDATPAGVRISAPLTLWEAHAQGEFRGLELRALYTQTTLGGAGQINQANGLTGELSVGQFLWGWYAELGYNLLPVLAPASRQSVSPFVRYERYNTQAEVPAGYSSDPANDRRVWTLGADYKPIPRVVLKADYQIRASHAGPGVDQTDLGAGWEF